MLLLSLFLLLSGLALDLLEALFLLPRELLLELQILLVEQLLGHLSSLLIILIKLLNELQRTGGRYGLATMCIGGGQGVALVVENLS